MMLRQSCSGSSEGKSRRTGTLAASRPSIANSCFPHRGIEEIADVRVCQQGAQQLTSLEALDVWLSSIGPVVQDVNRRER